jgi:DNA polymerase I-like protein with 3'-5' exonuclease and polymerase domains
VQLSRKPSPKRTESLLPAGIGEYRSITGRLYRFTEYDAPEFLVRRGTRTSFSPTQCKNYPIQGFATGDIVPEVLGRVFRALLADEELREKCLIINTVHDSIIFDCHKSVLDKACRLIRSVMEDAPKWMEKRYGFKIDLPLNVDVEYGHSWDSLENWKDE